MHKNGKKKIKIVASLFVFVVLLSFLCGTLISCSDSFSYTESDLSEYVQISASDYKNYTIEVPTLTATEVDVERKIMGLLSSNRASSPSNKGAKMFKVPVTVGDDVYIYYRGYTVDENGVVTEVDNTSNLLGSEYKLTVGSLSFLDGFEEGLIGAIPWDHHFDPEHERLTSGAVASGDVIYLTYSVMLPDGSSSYKSSERIDLSDDNIDDRYGDGFSEYFTSGEVEVGKRISSKTFTNSDGTVVYFDMKVNYALRCKNEPLVIEATFPYDYTDVSKRGLTVTFDVYFNGAVIYDTPEYDETFITETLKLGDKELSKYDGTTVEKHRAYLKDEVDAENVSIREALIEDKIWDYYRAHATVIKLPEDEVDEIFAEQYSQISSEYNMYFSSYYSSIEEYAYHMYGYSNLNAALLAESEIIITEKIIFYYIIREENLMPSDEKFDELYDKLVTDHLNYFLTEIYDDELAGLKTDAEREARILEIKEEMMDYYGEEYFAELVYYEYAYDTVKSFATIK